MICSLRPSETATVTELMPLRPCRLLDRAAQDARALEAGVVGVRGQHDRRDVRALGAQRRGVCRGLVRAAEHHRVVADLDAVGGRQARGSSCEEHAGHLVAREHDVLLEGARRDDDRLRVHHVQQVRADDDDLEALVDADRRVRRRELDQRLAAGVADEARDGLLDGPGRQLPAGLGLVDREHALARPRGSDRGGEPGGAEADHEHVGMAMHALEVARARPDTLTLPRPATCRMIGSTFGHAHFGLISVL